MCRHLAYLGRPQMLSDLLLTPVFGLHRQAWQPRFQQHGTVNADGFGIGWWAGAPRRPVRYRRDIPMWTDSNVTDFAEVTSSDAVVAAVRSATSGTAPGMEAAAPFSDGRHLFSHNGRIDLWPDDVGALMSDVEPAALVHLVARTDSALLWLLVQHALDAGMSLEQAMSHVTMRARASSPGRYNLLVHDGDQIVATAAGDTLFTRRDSAGVVVASEPWDDEGWEQVPEGCLVIATRDSLTVQPLEDGMS